VAVKLGLASGTARGRLHALHRQHAVRRTGEGKRGDPHYWSATRPKQPDTSTSETQALHRKESGQQQCSQESDPT
jgi:hypothetical protein